VSPLMWGKKMTDVVQEARPSPALTLWQCGLADHLAGRLDQAEASYRQLLTRDPDNVDALHMLGVLLFQRNQAAAGLDLLDAAIAINGEVASFHGHRGLILAALGRTQEAIGAYQTALTLNPHMTEVQNNLGNLLLAAGNIRGAIDAYRRAIADEPELAETAINLGVALMRVQEHTNAIVVLQNAAAFHPQNAAITNHLASAHNNYGTSLDQQGRRDEAIAAFRQAITIQPDLPEAHFNLGKSLTALDQFEEAMIEYRRAIAFKPDFSEAHNNLGIALYTLGMQSEAIASYCEALRHKPDCTHTLNNLANALRATGQIKEALETYRIGIALAPKDHELWNNLGSALDADDEVGEALAAFNEAIEICPSFAEAHNNRGNALKNLADLDAALTAYRRAVELDPDDPVPRDNYLYTLYFHPAYDLSAILKEHRAWNEQYAAPAARRVPPRQGDWSANRPLRIGYISPDFRDHVVGRNLVPLFRHHDHAQFHITCYFSSIRNDKFTSLFQSFADQWRPIGHLSDVQAAALIERDQIDVLVDLTLHMSGNRLGVFAKKPAPVQVTFAGYPGTTGLTAGGGIDYRITDPYLDPVTGDNDSFYSEKSWRLPNSFWCFDPLTNDPPVNALPAARNGYITFGCLNNFCKVNDGVLRLWSATLRQVPDSRLLLLAPRAVHNHVLDIFHRNGVEPHRIEFVGRVSRPRYLSFYHCIDIGLDTFPYNGHTTSLDSFWMGVPVITLVGNAPAGRAGWSQLSNLGLQELAAISEDQFVDVAVTLARNTSELAELRASFRDRLARSPLTDGLRFARDIEQAYRTFCSRALAL